MCETVKEVWDILETTYEGTKTVKNSKLQMLTSRFEEVRMKDDETFDEFYAKLNDIVNSSFNLGSSDKPRLVRCHECQGIGHYRNECPSYKKNQRKGKRRALVVSLRDNESETNDRQESSSSEDEGNYMTFVSTVKSESDKESDKVEEELPNDNSKKEKLASNLQNSLKSGSELKCVNEKLEDKIKTLTSELMKSNAHLQTFISGTKQLDNILEMNKPAGDRKGLGYVEGNTHVAGLSKTVFVSASKKVNAVSSSNKGKNVPREQSHQSRRNFIPRYPQPRTFEPRFIPTCHHYGALGHTKPRCYRLGNEHKNLNIPSKVSFLSNQVSHLTHMCGNKALFTTLDECTVQIHGLPVISNVLYVEGVRTTDNCYGVLSNSNYVCRSAKIDVSELWHKRLGHLNYKSLVQLAKKELVDGLPKIGPSENVVCGPC
ncbi:uncharacterized protein LOC111366626 [Olea europaea var. sylvestris]|uniref:uncharacterized protein LOC111366626 n=1 Tax=Olea europaea var. sylvestris TaxID=158386 RepID=UPI000C1D347F|nr:uncharacterized protein LOC111366626 [Olea europaea var. sylvestris]